MEMAESTMQRWRAHRHKNCSAASPRFTKLWTAAKRSASFGIAVIATFSWLLIDHSGISFLSLCSDVLLTLVILLFFRARNQQLQALPKLVLSEEIVNNAAALFRAKVNDMLLMAHDITLGKDFILFFVVVIALWLISVVGSLMSFAILSYLVPALYEKFENQEDRYAGTIHQKFTKHYKMVDKDS